MAHTKRVWAKPERKEKMAEYTFVATPIRYEFDRGVYRENESSGIEIKTLSVNVSSFQTLLDEFNAYCEMLEKTDKTCYRVSTVKAPGSPRAFAGFPIEKERGGKLNRVTHERAAKEKALKWAKVVEHVKAI